MTIQLRRVAAALAVPAALALTLSACGGDGGSSRPSADTIASSLEGGDAAKLLDIDKGDISDSAANCLAKKLHDSDLSNATLNALVKGDEDYNASDSEEDKLKSVFTDAMSCMTDAG